MSDAVLIALITGSLTLIGVIITAISGNKSIAAVSPTTTCHHLSKWRCGKE